MFSGRKSSLADVELQDVQDGGIVSPAKPRRTPWSEHLKSFVPKLKLPLAILVGAGITAGTTYALVKHVQHLIASARVSSDPDVWIHKARNDGYGACYNGCNDCHDIDFAYNACQKTARAIVPNIDCNGTRMWNWLDRYPTECLEALGIIYKAEALTRKKQSYRNQLAVIILTILAGVVGAFLVYKLWSRWFPPALPPAVGWPAAPPPYQPRARPRTRNRKQWPFFWRGAAAASIVGGSHAFPCWGYSSKADQYFVNENNTISGVIHGWTSNCYQESYICGQTCTTSNTGGGQDGGGGSTTTCTPDWCTRNVEDAAPKFYVNWSLRRVQDCGFHLVDNVEDEVSSRIANPLLERNWRVKISVNRYNVTDVTDPSVTCLWDIGNH